jgi:fermentation-respiration switch protein FrsA (DUF1100 family)
MLTTILNIVIVAYSGICAAMFLMQRSMMYVPDRTRVPVPVLGGTEFKELSLKTSDGQTLVAWAVDPLPGKPVVLYFHGNGGNFSSGRIEKFRLLTADGTGLFAVNYRGYGGSSGSPSEEGLHLDADAAYDAAAAKYGAQTLVGYGESLGTGVITQLAARKPLKALVLEAPFLSTVAVANEHFGWLPVSMLLTDQFRSDRAITKINTPLLVIHGDRDEVIPFEQGRALFELAAEPKQFHAIAGGRHNDLTSYGALERARDFFRDHTR